MTDHYTGNLLKAKDLMANALSHFNDKINLYDQSFFLTVRVKDKADIPLVKQLVFYRCCDALKTKASGIFGCRQPGLIICGDVEGSAERKPNFTNPHVSHLHGLLFVPKEILKLFAENELEDAIKKEIRRIREVINRDRAVYCEKYNQEKSIAETVSYAIKAEEMAASRGIIGYDCSVYPYDIVVGKIEKSKQRKLFSRKDHIFKLIKADPDPVDLDLTGELNGNEVVSSQGKGRMAALLEKIMASKSGSFRSRPS